MRDLSRLLRPRSIALFGGAWAENVARECRKIGFPGPVRPVHPTRAAMAGYPCLRRVEDLPEPPDAAFVGVNRAASVEIVRALSAMGAGGAVAFASGFAEAGDGVGDGVGEGAALQAALVEAAGPMPLLGPNCYGLVNYLDGVALWPDQHGGARVGRGVAFVSQSSNIALNVTMQRRGLPLAHAVCVGNQAQSGFAEIGAALAADPRVSALGFYIEGLRDPAAFAAMVAETRAAGKPVVVLRAGRSEGARTAAVSHTASLTGAETVAEAWFRRIGAPVVRSLPDMLDALHLLHLHGPLTERALIVLSSSGGEAGLMADAMEGRRLRLAELTAADRARIGATLNPLAVAANPLDYHTFDWGDAAALTRTFAAALETEAALATAILDFPHESRCDAASWEPAVEAVAAAAAATGRPVAIVSSLPENMPERRAAALSAQGLAPLTGLDGALAAIEIAADCGEPLGPPPLSAPAAQGAAVLLDEAEAKRRLAAFGVPVPDGAVCAAPETVAAEAAKRGAVAVKRLGLAHKTEAGAVALAPADPAAAAAAMGEGPWLVEAMVADGAAELIVGVARDPVFGLYMTLGAGGVLAELIGDSATLPLPAGPEEVERTLRGLRLFPLLDGHRGRPKADLSAAISAACAVAAFACAHAERLEELDVNPLIVTPKGAWAADALIRIRPA